MADIKGWLYQQEIDSKIAEYNMPLSLGNADVHFTLKAQRCKYLNYKVGYIRSEVCTSENVEDADYLFVAIGSNIDVCLRFLLECIAAHPDLNIEDRLGSLSQDSPEFKLRNDIAIQVNMLRINAVDAHAAVDGIYQASLSYHEQKSSSSVFDASPYKSIPDKTNGELCSCNVNMTNMFHKGKCIKCKKPVR